MSFSTAVSGLNAASNMLSVTGNNIANVNTTGFKNSRSEFADVYSTSIGSGGKTTPGSGVVTANVAQLFGQGNLQATGNNLDLAISGDGFFVLGEGTNNFSNYSYTRAGNFHTDQDGYVVSNNGQPLLAYRANGTTVEEGFSTGVLEPLRLDTGEGKPIATTRIDTSVNLDARKPTIASTGATAFVGPVDGVVDPATYTSSSSVTVYDSLGNSHLVSHYFANRTPTIAGAAGQWDVYTTVDGKSIETPVTADTLTFDSSGKLTSTMPITYAPFPITAPVAEDLTLSLDLTGSTQLGSAFSVNSLTQNGLTTGTLSGVDISDTGVVFARFTNGQSKPLGQVALVRFGNPQGLTKLGDTRWGESVQSGPPLTGIAGSGAFGSIKSGNLENSNVDLSQQLVNLIVAQQAYQANAQTITTENEITRTLLQIR